MKITVILLLSLLIKLYLADEEDYSFIKKFENGRWVSLDEGECPNLKNDPTVREIIAKRIRRKAMASSSTSVMTSHKTTTSNTAVVTTGETSDSTSSAMTSKVSTGASSQTTIASSTADTVTKEIGKSNCSETNGVTKIYKDSYSNGTMVYCDGVTDGGGWTVFQRRQDGSVDFLIGWNDYVNGFGNLEGEFWMGLEKLHLLLLDGNYELRIDLEDWDGNREYAKYSEFSISDASDNYRLRVDGYSGTAGNSLSAQNNQQFSAKPRDNDQASFDCAGAYGGGWWFDRCFYAHLNAQYHSQGPVALARGITWEAWKGLSYSLKFTEMKFRRKRY